MQTKNNYLLRLLIDILFITLCFYISKKISYFFNVQAPIRNGFLLVYTIFFWYFSSQATFLYKHFLTRTISEELILVIQTILLQFTFLVFSFFFLSHNPLDAKWFAITFLIIELIVLTVLKYVTRFYLGNLINKSRHKNNLIIVGITENSQILVEYINQHPSLGYKIIGFVDDVYPHNFKDQYLGNIKQLELILQEKIVNEIVIALSINDLDKIQSVVKISQDNGKRVMLIPDYYLYSSKFSLINLGSLPIITLNTIPLDSVELRFFKRAFDLIITLFVFVFIISWLFPIVALLIKLTSEGPVFFVQERWGMNSNKILCYKFRTMYYKANNEIDTNGNFRPTEKNDNRITKIGAFLRKHNLDEFPQFYNVLKGEMSLIGPRPHASLQNIEMKSIINNYNVRHFVNTGITGWAQVNGYRGETKTIDLMQKRVDYDIWYIENWSFWLDCQIILQTVINMIKGDKNAY